MSKSYTPGLKILENALIKKKRILPLSGKLHVKKDDLVKSDQIVASANIPGNVQMLNVSNKLNIDPNQILDCMLCKVDEEVKKPSHASTHRKTEVPKTTYRIQEQNFRMNVENRFRSLEVSICHLTTIVEGINKGGK